MQVIIAFMLRGLIGCNCWHFLVFLVRDFFLLLIIIIVVIVIV